MVTAEEGNVVTVQHIANSKAIQANVSSVSDNTATADTATNYSESTTLFTVPTGSHIKCVFIPIVVEYSSSGMGGKPINFTFQKVTGGADIPTGVAFMHNQNMNTLAVGVPVIEEYTLESEMVVGCVGTWMSSSSSATAKVKGRLKLYVGGARWI